MADRKGFFSVRGLSQWNFEDALVAASSHCPSYIDSERFVLGRDGQWDCALVLDRFEHVHRWAQAVSAATGATSVSFLVTEGTWDYSVISRGDPVIYTRFYPRERPEIYGQPAIAAQVLDCDEEVFRRYLEAIVDACAMEDDDDLGSLPTAYPRAYADDFYAAADEYGYIDFARRIGVPGDPVFDSEPLLLRPQVNRGTDWSGLSPM